MKQLKTILLLLIVILCSINIFAKTSLQKTTFKVNGNCEMCKKRIETGAKIAGVKKAVWNQKTHIMEVQFDNAKTNITEIQKNISSKGYDTETSKTTTANYNKLPECCQYKRD